MSKIIIPVFCLILALVSVWMFRYQYFDREKDGRKYTTRQHIFTNEECYFVGEFKRPEVASLGLVHCAIIDNEG